ncbi:MAG: fliC [Firmicutes bacterium]|nr:fliC [Bacillota bacterium]
MGLSTSIVGMRNQLNSANAVVKSSMQKIASGLKINSAQDDASAYTISVSMSATALSLAQANQNTQTSSAMMSVASGAIGSSVENLSTLKEKLLNAANGTNSDSDISALQKEVDQVTSQLNDNASATFNGKYLIDGSMSGSNASNVQGSNGSDAQLSISDMTAQGLGLQDGNGNSTIDLSSSDGIANAIDLVDTALQSALSQQTQIGAQQQALQYSSDNYATSEYNTIAAQSTIADADVAKESMKMHQGQVLAQVNLLMMAQSNQNGSSVLALLR